MKKILIGAAAGAGAMYFLDPSAGAARRRRALHLWAENKDDVYQTAKVATEQVQSVSQQAASVAGEAASKVTSTISDKVSKKSDEAPAAFAGDSVTADGSAPSTSPQGAPFPPTTS